MISLIICHCVSCKSNIWASTLDFHWKGLLKWVMCVYSSNRLSFPDTQSWSHALFKMQSSTLSSWIAERILISKSENKQFSPNHLSISLCRSVCGWQRKWCRVQCSTWHRTVEVLWLKDGTFTEPIVLRKLMNDSYSQQCAGTHVWDFSVCIWWGGSNRWRPVAECCHCDTYICCLLLCLFKNALEPTAETSIYICHRQEGGEGGPMCSHHGFQYMLELWR